MQIYLTADDSLCVLGLFPALSQRAFPRENACEN